MRLTLAAFLFASLVPPMALAQGIQSTTAPVASSYSSSAPSGSNGFKCQNVGCRVSLGSATEYLYSDGSNIKAPTAICSTYGSCIGSSVTTPNNVQAAGHLFLAAALPTCVSGVEGAIYRLTGTGGTNSGSQTRFCVCVSSGAASPVYSWVNMLTNTAGNSTTCNP